jgi:dienelactone hydrolase
LGGEERGERGIRVRAGASSWLDAIWCAPDSAAGAVVMASSNACGRMSRRAREVGRLLRRAGYATLRVDLLAPEEDEIDRLSAELRFDVELLAGRLAALTDWLATSPDHRGLRLAYFGSGAAVAALVGAAARRRHLIHAIVSMGGRPDLGGAELARVEAPTLLIVGSRDLLLHERNRAASAELGCENKLAVVAGATDLFDEPGALVEVARLASAWLDLHLASQHEARRAG